MGCFSEGAIIIGVKLQLGFPVPGALRGGTVESQGTGAGESVQGRAVQLHIQHLRLD